MTVDPFETIPYFNRLDAVTLTDVKQSATRHVFDAGEIVFQEGESNSGLWIVESGWLKVVKYSLGGREQVLQYLGPGENLNLVGVFVDKPNPASIYALEPTVLYHIPHEIMLHLIDHHADLARLIIVELADRVLHLVNMVDGLSLHSVETRLARYLLEQMDAGSVTRQRWATQGEIAAHLGTVPDVVNRVFRKLSEEGIIELSRHQVRILDRQKLAEKAATDLQKPT